MDLAEQLRVLEAAQGDPSRLALATVDLAYPALAVAEREALKEALEAAAIPHWCDAPILAVLLEVSAEDGAARLARLRRLTVVEPFPARGEGAVNVHEASRLALRVRLARDEPERFARLSAQAAKVFERGETPAQCIEWIYHRLCAAPEAAAEELETLDREWTSAARPEDRAALATALKDLEVTKLLGGAARVEMMLCLAEVRNSRGETSRLEAPARAALGLARSLQRLSAEARANCLLGDSLLAQGRLPQAEATFRETLDAFRRLAETQPDNLGWRRDLAVAHSRVGDVLQAQDKLAEAQVEFAAYLEINRHLHEQDPDNADWLRGLAVAHSRVGDILHAQGKLAEAQAAFGEYLKLSQTLAGKDRGNASWQRGLAVAHSRMGDVHEAQGQLPEAQAAFRQYRRICQELAQQDPTNADWQRELAVAHSRMGGVLQAQGKLAEAQEAFGEDLKISRQLVEQDAANASLRFDLAVTLRRIAATHVKAGSDQAALPAYEEAALILRKLAEKAPGFAAWAKEKAAVESELAACRAKVKAPATLGTGPDRDAPPDAHADSPPNVDHR